MKSHSYIPTQSIKALAQKINRSGVTRLHSEETTFIEQNLDKVAGSCRPDRAKELFSFFNKPFPEGFQCDPVAGESDAEMERIRAKLDEKRRS